MTYSPWFKELHEFNTMLATGLQDSGEAFDELFYNSTLADVPSLYKQPVKKPAPPVFLDSYLLGRRVEIEEVYDLNATDLDMVIVECKTLVNDPKTSTDPESRGKYLASGYFLHLAEMVSQRRYEE